MGITQILHRTPFHLSSLVIACFLVNYTGIAATKVVAATTIAGNHESNSAADNHPTEGSRLELEWLHMGEYYSEPSNTHEYPSHDFLQLRGRIQMRDNISLFARIENLTDEKYASRADFAFGDYRFFGGQVRAFHTGVTVNF